MLNWLKVQSHCQSVDKCCQQITLMLYNYIRQDKPYYVEMSPDMFRLVWERLTHCAASPLFYQCIAKVMFEVNIYYTAIYV